MILSFTHRLTLAAGLMLSSLAPVAAHEFNLGGLFVDHPHAHPTEAGATEAEGYLTIRNTTKTTDALTEIRGPFAGTTLRHNVEVGDEMRLVPVDRLAIPRGATITFSTDALHVLFEPLESDGFKTGDLIATTFVFEEAGEMDVIFVVEEPGTAHH